MLTMNKADGPEHDDDERGRGEAAQEAGDQAQAAEELPDRDGIAEQPHAVGGRLDHGRQARPAEGPEELLRSVGGEDDPDDDAHDEQSDVHCRAVLRPR